MEDLLKFLRARLDEDEAAARAATPGPWSVDNSTYAEAINSADGTAVVAGGRWGDEASAFESTEDAQHIARHDPARVLREVASKRKAIEDYERMATFSLLIRIMGEVYSDHQDYDPAWSATRERA